MCVETVGVVGGDKTVGKGYLTGRVSSLSIIFIVILQAIVMTIIVQYNH